MRTRRSLIGAGVGLGGQTRGGVIARSIRAISTSIFAISSSAASVGLAAERSRVATMARGDVVDQQAFARLGRFGHRASSALG